MTVDCEISLPQYDEIGKTIHQQMKSILTAAGQNLAKCIRRHMRHLNATRHSPLSGGKPSNHFSPNKVLDPVISDNAATVAVAIAGITRAYHDIDIYPKEASALAIPLHASAYGISPRENNDRGIYDLFRINKSGSTEKGNVLYRKEGDELIPMYALTQHVHQVRDPSLMPTEMQMKTAGLDGVAMALKAIFEQQGL